MTQQIKNPEIINQLETREGWLGDCYEVDRNDPMIRKIDFVQNSVTTVVTGLILPVIGFGFLFCAFLLVGGLLKWLGIL